MSEPVQRRRPWAALGLALLALGAALGFYWHSLLDESVPSRTPIPVSELKPGAGFAVSWRVKDRLPAWRWARTGVRVWEAGKALPRRVENDSLVSRQGQGRICVKGDLLWFSASDNSNPLNNGRTYEFELDRPNRWPAAVAIGLFVLALIPWSALLLRWLRSRPWNDSLSPERAAQASWMGGSILVALAVLASILPHLGIERRLLLNPAAVIQQADGRFCYFLAHWISNDPFRIGNATLWEDSWPLRRAPLASLNQDGTEARFAIQEDSICFRPGHKSGIPDHTYTLHVPLFATWPAAWWSLFLGSVGLLLLCQARSTQTALRFVRAGTGEELARFRQPAWWVPVSLVCLCKLWVVAGDEPLAQTTDAFRYAAAAAGLPGGGEGTLPSFPGGFPFVAGTMAQFGLPWRMSIELLYLLACNYLTLAVVPLARSKLTGFLLFFLMVWLPWTLAGFRDFMSDPLVLVLLVASLGALLRLLAQPAPEWRAPTFLLLGSLLWLWEWSRHEGPLVYASYGLFVVLACAAIRGQSPKAFSRRTMVLLALPLAIILFSSSVVKFFNYQRTGIYAKSIIDSPGLKALMQALYRVKPDQEIRFAPVTRQSLRAACEASPTLKPFEAALMDPRAGELGATFTRVPGEFGTLLNRLLPYSLPADRRVANQLMLRAAAELDAARLAGRLPSRRAWYPLDPNWHLWLPDLPRTWLRWFKEGMWMAPDNELWATQHRPILQYVFDAAANRRAAHIYPRLFLAEGALTAPPGAIDSVAVADDRGRWLGASLAYSSNWWLQGQAFDLHWVIEENPAKYRLLFLLQGKPQHELEFVLPTPSSDGTHSAQSRFSKKESSVALPGAKGTLSYSFEATLLQSAGPSRRELWELVLQGRYVPTLWLALAVAGACMLTGGPRQNRRTTICCLLLVAGWFTGRAAFYGLLDANMGWGMVRYMRCVSPLFILILFLCVIAVCGKSKKQKAESSNPSGVQI